MKPLNMMLISIFMLMVWTQTGCAQKDDTAKDMDDIREIDELFTGNLPGCGMGMHFNLRNDDDDDALLAPPRHMNMLAMKDLNLSKEQTDKIKSLHTALKKQNIPLNADLKLKRIEMKELMDAEKPDKDKVTTKIKEMESIRTKIHTNRAVTHIEVMNVLTKEQREKLEQQRCFGPRHMMDRPFKKMKRIRVFEKD